MRNYIDILNNALLNEEHHDNDYVSTYDDPFLENDYSRIRGYLSTFGLDLPVNAIMTACEELGVGFEDITQNQSKVAKLIYNHQYGEGEDSSY